MARRWLVSDGNVAREIHTAKVAVGGAVKPITKACVAMGGVVRQFYPPYHTPPEGESRVVMTTDAVTVAEQKVSPETASAALRVNRFYGYAQYNNHPDADAYFQCINPGLDGTAGDDGKYIIKVDQVSGTALTGTLATWIDINSLAEHVWSLDQPSVGTLTATANLSVAEDNGAGGPAAGTTVVKPITFNSTVVPTGFIIWSEEQRDLVEIKTGEDASCTLTFSPDGFAVGSADTSGSFSEAWHINTPSVGDPSVFTVQVDLISGTAPTGLTLGVPLTLDELRQTVLVATTGENLTCELDVTVDDLVPVGNDRTKRVTMNSQRTTPVPEPVWTEDGWSCSDAGYPQGAGLTVSVFVTFNIDGTAKLEMESSALTKTEFDTEDWFDTPPPLAGDLNSYEVMIDYKSGAGLASGAAFGTWVRMTENRAWEIEYVTRLKNQKKYTLYANVRKVGGLAITKPITVTVIKSDGTTP